VAVPIGAGRKEVTVDGLRTALTTSGPPTDTTAVAFIHGSSGTGRQWQRLVDEVGTFARCLAPDMPGYGDSDKPASFDYNVDGYAHYLDGLFKILGVRRVHVVGHDLGGPWALAWAALDPSRIASLTMIGIGVMPGYRWHRYARLYRLPILGELVLSAANRRSVERVLRSGSKHSIPDSFSDEVARLYRDPGTRRAVLRFYRATPDLGQETVRAAAALRDVDLPTLVIWGRGDPYVPARFAELQRGFFPGAQIVVLPDSGHWPLEDDYAASVGAILPFLREQTATRPPTCPRD
jgi:pimeloyl-ACP methyl ester carboxylesterase